MIELPEAYVLADQLNRTIVGKTITNVTANASPHKFAFFNGDPATYHDMLTGRTVESSNPGTGYTCGGNVEIICGDVMLVISTPIRYHAMGDKLPAKHQLHIEFEGFDSISCTVQMWGAMICCNTDASGIPEGYTVNRTPSALESSFDEVYFQGLFNNSKKNISAKAFLATEQRIPGLGNGVLQDILFNASINPRTKLDQLSDTQLRNMYNSVKSTLGEMFSQGGRDTEKDLFGCSGGYKTILSNKTVNDPCPCCGGDIVREAYMGGNIYYCPTCQPKP